MKMNRFYKLLLVLFFFIPGPAQAQDGVYHFGILSVYDEKTINEGFGPFVDYLSEYLGKPVKLIIPDSYDDMMDKLVNNEVQFALIGPAMYVHLKKRYPELKYLATAQVTKFGEKRSYYYSRIIVHKDSGISKLSEMEHRSFAFTNEQSTSGYRFPMVFFEKRGIDPVKYFSRVIFAGNHEDVIDLVSTRKIYAGATFDYGLQSAEITRGKIFNTIAKIGPIVNLPLVANHHVGKNASLAITDAFVNIPKALLTDHFPYTGFETLSDSSYDPIREVVFNKSQINIPKSILAKAMETNDLNTVYKAFDQLNYDKRKIHDFINKNLMGKRLTVTGKVLSKPVKNVYYGDGWHLLGDAFVLDIGNDRKASIKADKTAYKINEVVTLKAKILGTKDTDGVAIEVVDDVKK